VVRDPLPLLLADAVLVAAAVVVVAVVASVMLSFGLVVATSQYLLAMIGI